MKKLVFAKGLPEVCEVPIPKLLPNTVLVKTMYSFVSSGTEIATLQKNKLAFAKKLFGDFEGTCSKIFESLKQKGLNSTFFQACSYFFKKLDVGYSSSGVVVASSVKDFRKGDFVACSGFGFAHHADFAVLPVNLLAKIMSADFLQDASSATIVAIAIHGLRRAGLQFGEIVCVVGLGLLGQIVVQLAKNAGLVVIGVDLIPDRLEIAKKNGADFVFSANSEWRNSVCFASNRLGVDAVILAAGSSSSHIIDDAISICRKKAKIVLLGDVPIAFSREEFYKKELDFSISCSSGPGRYDDEYELNGISYPYHLVRWTETRNLQLAVHLIEKKKINISALVSGVFPLNFAKEAYALLKQGEMSVVFSYQNQKMIDSSVILPEGDDQNIDLPLPAQKYVVRSFGEKNFVSCALVGAGGFAKTMLLPILKKIGIAHLDIVCDNNFLAAKNCKDSFGFERILSDFDSVLYDDEVDVVILTTPDTVHSSQTIAALTTGKAVFCEKPMVTNWNEYHLLKNLLENRASNGGAFFTVDFNRSFAPMILDVKHHLQSRISPLLINYRIAAGMIKKENFHQNMLGRIVGEVCHFLELFLFLHGGFPSKMMAAFSDSSTVNFEENLTVTLSFSDGSILNILYSSLANENLGKERLEIFFDKKTIIIDDFLTMTTLGFSENFSTTLLVPDKGHGMILSSFLDSVIRNNYEIFSKNWSRYLAATYLSLKLEEMVFQGGGVLRLSFEESQHTI